MDILALLLVVLAALAFAPWPPIPKLRPWGVTILLLAVVAQMTTVTDHLVDWHWF